jgi:hypothetical protein
MDLVNYKNLKKADWQTLATKFNVEWTDESVVRYLVEKIAEKIGVDDKISSDNLIKKEVCEKLLNNPDLMNQPTKEKVVKAKTTKTKVSKPKETKVPVLSRLEELRLECEKYGVAWVDKHTEEGLEQLLTAIKSAGVTPISTDTFEISSDNVDSISSVTTIQQTESNKVETPTIYTSNNGVLLNYRNIYLNAIRGHFRCLFAHEIEEMISRDNVPFTFEVKFNPQQRNKVEIILTMGTESVRVPSDNNNDWIEING